MVPTSLQPTITEPGLQPKLPGIDFMSPKVQVHGLQEALCDTFPAIP